LISYSYNMTLSERNVLFKTGIIFSSVCTLLMMTASFLVISVYPGIGDAIRRPMNAFQFIAAFFLSSSYYAVHVSIAISILFSLIGIILIHSFFERTSAPEILYIAIFTISLAFEVIRIILPLHFLFNFPAYYMRAAFRVLLFVRFFSLFSLFAAGLCSAGLDVQKTRNIIFVIIIASFILTLGVPIDVLNWDASLNMVIGFSSMFRTIEIVTIFTTMISFLIAAKVRGSKDYTYIAAGTVLVLAGRDILLSADNWAGPFFGILLLSTGTWFLCSKLHKIHLWL